MSTCVCECVGACICVCACMCVSLCVRVCVHAYAQQRGYTKSLMVMIKGMNSLFWMDLNSESTRFQGVFAFLIDRLTDPEHRYLCMSHDLRIFMCHELQV